MPQGSEVTFHCICGACIHVNVCSLMQLCRVHIQHGWPIGQSPSVSWSIMPDFALNWQDT